MIINSNWKKQQIKKTIHKMMTHSTNESNKLPDNSIDNMMLSLKRKMMDDLMNQQLEELAHLNSSGLNTIAPLTGKVSQPITIEHLPPQQLAKQFITVTKNPLLEKWDRLKQKRQKLIEKTWIRKAGIVKKEGDNFGKIFTYLQDANDKDVTKKGSFEFLEKPIEEIAELKFGETEKGKNKGKKFSILVLKEFPEVEINGTFEFINV